MRLGWLKPVGFAVSFVAMIPLAVRVADPWTHRPVQYGSSGRGFPVVVVDGDDARVEMVEDPWSVPAPPAGASYLVPSGRVRSVGRSIRANEHARRDREWVLFVEDVSEGRQRVELFLLGDGYWGGAYEATATTVTPLYRKTTGPGFSLVVILAAHILNGAAWGAMLGGWWLYRRRPR